MSKHSYKEQERQRREQEILKIAGQLMVERGTAELNMDDLADQVGISKPTLYQHFRSKDELVSQVILNSFGRMREHLSHSLTGTPIERLEQILRHVIKSRFAPDSIWQSVDAESLWPLLSKHPVLVENRANAIQGMRELVDAAKAQGQIRADIPTPIVVRSLFCLQNVFKDPGMKSELVGSPENLDKAIDFVVQIFLQGVTTHTTEPTPHHESVTVSENKD